jgi:hypothetical protein
LFIASCSLKVDQPKAKHLVESLLNDLKNENFSNIDQYYISSFNESEPKDKKIEKYNRLKEVIGSIVSYEFVIANEKYNDYSNIKMLELIYNVNGAKVKVRETFQVVNDEGDLKIVFQNVENMN